MSDTLVAIIVLLIVFAIGAVFWMHTDAMEKAFEELKKLEKK